jgi:hypothetical protein
LPPTTPKPEPKPKPACWCTCNCMADETMGFQVGMVFSTSIGW